MPRPKPCSRMRMPQKPWMVEMGAEGMSAMVFIHCPGFAYSAVRILSRISAAAFSVNVTAAMRIGSMPCSISSRYISTSLRVLPVPALAQTTVLVLNGIFVSRGFNSHTGGTTYDIHNRHRSAYPQGPDKAGPREPSPTAPQSVPAHRRTPFHRSHTKPQDCPE